MSDKDDPHRTLTVPPPDSDVDPLAVVPSIPRNPPLTGEGFGVIPPPERELRITMTTKEFAEIAGRILADKFDPLLREVKDLLGKDGTLEKMRRQFAAMQMELSVVHNVIDNASSTEESNSKILQAQVGAARREVTELRETIEQFKGEISARFDGIEGRVTKIETAIFGERDLATRVQRIEDKVFGEGQ